MSRPQQPVDLIDISSNADRPQEARVSALRALAGFDDPRTIDTLEAQVSDPARQIRLASLTSLAAIAKSETADSAARAVAILCRAMEGAFQIADRQDADGDDEADDLAAPKIEGRQAGRITITPDGDIVDAEEQSEPAAATSTLDAIQSSPADSTAAEQPEPSKKRGRRVAVDGPDDISLDIRVLAFGVSGDCENDEIADAFCKGAYSNQDRVRSAAFEAIARRSDALTLGPELCEVAIEALTESNPFIRGKAAYAVSKGARDGGAHFSPLVGDEDAIVRSIAIAEAAKSDPALAVNAMGDPSPLVRGAALTALIAMGEADPLADGVANALSIGATDTLSQAANRSAVGRAGLIGCLSDLDRSTKDRLAALQAIAQTDPICWQSQTHSV